MEGSLIVALQPFEGLWLQNAPEEEALRLEQPLLRVVLKIKGLWKAGCVGRLVGALFLHPEFEQLYLKHRPFDTAPCLVSVTERGLVIEGRPAHFQTLPGSFKPWRVELPFVDEGVQTIDREQRPILIDPDKPQDPEFIHKSLLQLDTVFAKLPDDLRWKDPKAWCKERFVDGSGSIGCTEILPGLWLASQDGAGEALLICSTERFASNATVEAASIFLHSPTTLVIRVPRFSAEQRESLWKRAWGDDFCQPEVEAIRPLLRSFIHDRNAHGTPQDALEQPISPRPFWCQRYY
jgi:hypothetical protein